MREWMNGPLWLVHLTLPLPPNSYMVSIQLKDVQSLRVGVRESF